MSLYAFELGQKSLNPAFGDDALYWCSPALPGDQANRLGVRHFCQKKYRMD
jgi:hypothetical protein